MLVHLDGRSPVEASCQQLAGLDGDRCELPLGFQDVSDGVDVGHVGLLFIVHWDFSIPTGRHGEIFSLTTRKTTNTSSP